MGVSSVDRIQGLHKSILFIGLFTTSLFNQFAFTMLIKPGAASQIYHQASYEKPPDYSSSASAFPLDCHSFTMQQEKRVLIHGNADHIGGKREYMEDQDMKRVRTLRKRLGSRPPMCRDKCESCFPCEAVKMVPTPTISSSAMQHVAHLDYSNYDPEGWKCKCGARIFNP